MSLKDINNYIIEVSSHYSELTSRQSKVEDKEIEESLAERDNTQCLLQFHEKLSNLLKKCELRILPEQEKTAKVSRRIFKSII